jgi:hypothetical protein
METVTIIYTRKSGLTSQRLKVTMVEIYALSKITIDQGCLPLSLAEDISLV